MKKAADDNTVIIAVSVVVGVILIAVAVGVAVLFYMKVSFVVLFCVRSVLLSVKQYYCWFITLRD